MKVLVFALMAQAVALFAYASPNDDVNYCKPWYLVSDVICNFGNNDGNLWKRDCSNSPDQCRNRRFDRSQCDAEDICLGTMPNSPTQKMDPNVNLPGVCTEWMELDGSECADRSGHLVQEWFRKCQKNGISTNACSNSKPEDWPEDGLKRLFN